MFNQSVVAFVEIIAVMRLIWLENVENVLPKNAIHNPAMTDVYKVLTKSTPDKTSHILSAILNVEWQDCPDGKRILTNPEFPKLKDFVATHDNEFPCIFKMWYNSILLHGIPTLTERGV